MAKVKWFGDELEREVKKQQSIALRKSGVLLEREIKKSMKPGHYRKYKRGKKSHWSSSPGGAPSVDTGRLRASITFQVSDGVGTEPKRPAKSDDGVKKPQAGKDETICVVGTNMEYGLPLELGHGKTEPRPFLGPALEKNKKKILSFFKGLLK